ncbi:hypothetical protein SLEP1_g53716 [Rubroshorea leprosula]|uniref:Uncharacterized protein n=1 Tax=Rubroshorea leprosula TaxID=152421 RepID=A0AAV5MAA5_9ROSI|nr:hypothetical protein SLEP1_g53716 [Rubroshorea leprosula]
MHFNQKKEGKELKENKQKSNEDPRVRSRRRRRIQGSLRVSRTQLLGSSGFREEPRFGTRFAKPSSWIRETQLLGSRNPVAGFAKPSCWVRETRYWVPRGTKQLGFARNPDLGFMNLGLGFLMEPPCWVRGGRRLRKRKGRRDKREERRKKKKNIIIINYVVRPDAWEARESDELGG